TSRQGKPCRTPLTIWTRGGISRGELHARTGGKADAAHEERHRHLRVQAGPRTTEGPAGPTRGSRGLPGPALPHDALLERLGEEGRDHRGRMDLRHQRLAHGGIYR